MENGKTKRINREIKQFRNYLENGQFQNIELLDTENQFESITILLYGPLDSPYENFGFRISIEWSEDYPYKPPKCRFLDKVWNPYVCFESGQICLDILKEQFSPALSFWHLILSISALLSESKIQDHDVTFMNVEAAGQMLNNYNLFYASAKAKCQNQNCKQKAIYKDEMRGIPQEHKILVDKQEDLEEKIKQDISQNRIKPKSQQSGSLNQSEEN